MLAQIIKNVGEILVLPRGDESAKAGMSFCLVQNEHRVALNGSDPRPVAHDARIFEQHIEPVVIHYCANAWVKPFESCFESRPFVADHLTAEARVEDVSCHICEPSIVTACKQVCDGCRVFNARLNGLKTAVSLHSHRQNFAERSHQAYFKNVVPGMSRVATSGVPGGLH